MKTVKLIVIAIATIFSIQLMANHFSVQKNNANNESVQLVIEEYSEIDVATLPKLILEAVEKDHKNATITKAFVNKEGTYKIVLDKKGTVKTLYANATGEWLTKE